MGKFLYGPTESSVVAGRVEGETGEELGVSRIAFGREQPLPTMRENENKYRGYQTSRPQVLRILFMLLLTAFARRNFTTWGPA